MGTTQPIRKEDELYSFRMYYADEKPNSYLPSDCFQTESGKFIKTATKDYYNGRTILQIMGGGNKFYWVLEDYIE